MGAGKQIQGMNYNQGEDVGGVPSRSVKGYGGALPSRSVKGYGGARDSQQTLVLLNGITAKPLKKLSMYVFLCQTVST